MEKMTPEQALDILKEVGFAHVGTRQAHIAIEQALAVLAELITPQPEPKKESKK